RSARAAAAASVARPFDAPLRAVPLATARRTTGVQPPAAGLPDGQTGNRRRDGRHRRHATSGSRVRRLTYGGLARLHVGPTERSVGLSRTLRSRLSVHVAAYARSSPHGPSAPLGRG